MENIQQVIRPPWFSSGEWIDLGLGAAQELREREEWIRRGSPPEKAPPFRGSLTRYERLLRGLRWARGHGLALVAKGTSNAWERMARTTVRRNGARSLIAGSGHVISNLMNCPTSRRWFDHPGLWNYSNSGRPARPACITSEPYGYDREEVDEFARERGLLAIIHPKEKSIYYPGETYFIQVWAPGPLVDLLGYPVILDGSDERIDWSVVSGPAAIEVSA